MQEPSWERSLVDRLVADARPVRRLWRPEVRLLMWLMLALLLLVTPASRVLRADLAARLQAPGFLLEEWLLLIGAVLLGLEALRSALPDHRVGTMTTRIGWGALGVAVLLMLREPVHGAWTADAFLDLGRPCVWRALAWGALPWMVLLFAIRRGAPFARRRTGVLAGAASWGLTCVALRVCCQTDELLHLGAFHALPLLVGTLASAVVAPIFLADRWGA